MDTSKRILPEHEREFPNLYRTGYEKTSEEDEFYNCIAWAAGEENTEEFWTPFRLGNGYYWPEGLSKNSELETFVKLYEIKGGYIPCEKNSTELEDGVEKIALYVDSQNKVCHAARQKEDGSWASKLGDWEDIEHRELDGLSGDSDYPAYGRFAKILRRGRKKQTL